MRLSSTTWLTLAAALVVAIGVGRAVVDQGRISQQSAPAPELQQKSPQAVSVFPTDPIRGPADAPVTVVVFSDYQCPYCADVEPLLSEVVQNPPGRKVRVVWKDFPLPQYAESQPAAEAAQCAALQGKFWEYHDALFAEQGKLGAARYQEIASSLGLNSATFQQCLTRHQTLPLITQNQQEGTAIGVDGTPFLVVNGQAFSGTVTRDELVSLVR